MKTKGALILDTIFEKKQDSFFSLASLSSREDLLYTDIEGRSLLTNSIIAGNMIGVVRYLLERIPTLMSVVDKKGLSPLHYSILMNDIESARLLITSGAQIDCIDKFGNTPLWRGVFEAKGKNYEIVDFLVQSGANPTIKNNSDISPLDFAIKIGDKHLTSILNSSDKRPAE